MRDAGSGDAGEVGDHGLVAQAGRWREQDVGASRAEGVGNGDDSCEHDEPAGLDLFERQVERSDLFPVGLLGDRSGCMNGGDGGL